jgi:peptidoglycan hydrolase-like protein with peptidoglycan-binding domain
MRNMLPLVALLVATPLMAQAQSLQYYGGPNPNAQTIHHCGFLKSSAKRYTTSSLTVGIIEHKLAGLGYRPTVDGRYRKRDKSAVRSFQRDRGIRVDGIVGPITTQHLAYASHPGQNVHRCYGMASALR